MKIALPRVIIFDFDGVIVQSNHIKDGAFETIFREFPEHYEQMVAHHYADNSRSRYEKFDHIAREVLRLQGEEKDHQVAVWLKQYQSLTRQAVIDCDYVPGALEFLKKYSRLASLYIASATPQEELDAIVDGRGIRHFFKGVYGKPELKVQMFDRILEMEGLDQEAKSEVLFVGDSFEDWRSAHARGLPFVAILQKYSFEKERCRVFRNLEELHQAIES